MFKIVSDVVFVFWSGRGFCRTHLFHKCEIYIFCHFSIAIVVACRRALVLDTDQQAFASCHGCRDGFSVSSTAQHRSIESKQLTRTGSGSEHRQQDRTRESKQLLSVVSSDSGIGPASPSSSHDHGSSSEPRQGDRTQHSTASQHTDRFLSGSYGIQDIYIFIYIYIYVYTYM